MRYAILVIAAFMLSTLFCTGDMNPVDSLPTNIGNDKLYIRTDENAYSWKQSESRLIIIIQGSLENKSEVTYYSKTGDGYGPPEQDQLFFAENSAGKIEKYNQSDNSWYETNILGFLIEGSRFVPLNSSKVYSIYAHLTINKDREEKGKYRLRIDYYDNINPKNNSKPFKDYSNTFLIR